jgi:hypothetical protein
MISSSTADPVFDMVVESLFTVWIDYDGHQLAVSIDPSQTKPASPILVENEDLTRLGTSAYLGVSRATGQTYQQNHIVAWRMSLE